jgi:predicted ATPase
LALKANSNFRNIAGERFYLGSLFLIEEPEGNLHPAYQSKLANMFMEASAKFNVQFMIETHSEYLIRNFQFLTATRELNTADTKIFYFFQPGTVEYLHSNFSTIQIENDGRFNNEFGAGFFDELPRLLTSLDNIGVN